MRPSCQFSFKEGESNVSATEDVEMFGCWALGDGGHDMLRCFGACKWAMFAKLQDRNTFCQKRFEYFFMLGYTREQLWSHGLFHFTDTIQFC